MESRHLGLHHKGPLLAFCMLTGTLAFGQRTAFIYLRQIAREIGAQRVVSFQPGRRKDPQALRKIRIEVANPELKGLKFRYRQRY